MTPAPRAEGQPRMSISPRLMKILAKEDCSHMKRFYYQTRCLFNRDIDYRRKDKEGTVRFQFQADQIQSFIDPKNADKVMRPPKWLYDWAAEECKKFYGQKEPAPEPPEEVGDTILSKTIETTAAFAWIEETGLPKTGPLDAFIEKVHDGAG